MKSKYLIIAFVSIPLLIAGIQLYFHVTSDLVSWRGGGFGMYSDPHTNSSRFLWITGINGDKLQGVRLSPLDDRLYIKSTGEHHFYRAINKLEDVGHDHLNFPSSKDLRPLKELYQNFIEEHGENELVQDIFPTDSLRFIVMLQAIAPDFEHIESKELTNLPF